VKQVNQKLGRTGTLFEGRFRSSLVDSEAYCLACYRYIELNPVRAQLVNTPDQWRWSSYHSNALGFHDPLISPHPEWIGLGRTDELRRVGYRGLFADQIHESELCLIREKTKKCLPLGSEEFSERVARKLDVKLRFEKLGRPPTVS
jgi:putative transposase